MSGERKRIVIGKVGGPFGVKGWVKLLSWTEPRERSLSTPLGRSSSATGGRNGRWPSSASRQGTDRPARGPGRPRPGRRRCSAPTSRCGATSWVRPEPGQYYWADLVGLEVQLAEGAQLRQGGRSDGHRRERRAGGERRTGTPHPVHPRTGDQERGPRRAA